MLGVGRGSQSVAQLVESVVWDHGVASSSLATLTKNKKTGAAYDL